MPAQRSLRSSGGLLTGALGLLFWVAAVPGHCQAVGGSGPPYFATAQSFLKAVYPGLEKKDYVMTVDVFGAFDTDWVGMPPFGVEIGSAEQGHEDLVGGNSTRSAQTVKRKPVLTASFNFDQIGLVEVHIHSESVTLDSENEKMRQIVNVHQGWSDQQVTTALRQAGAHFDPERREHLLRNLPTEALKPLIGALQVDSAEFRVRHQQEPTSIAELYWVIEGHSEMGDGRKFEWELRCEPFNGELISVARSVPPR
jgi:hypothetical protein